MLVIPAVDILHGRCVRLAQGDFSKVEDFGSPIESAKRWEKEGAKMLHVVDLDGARTGSMENLPIIKRIITDLGIPVQVGGGIRDFYRASELLEAGARIVLGTAAIKNPEMISELVGKFGKDKVGVAVDAKDGMVAVEGWMKKTSIPYIKFSLEMERKGVGFLLFTSVQRDGMLGGPDVSRVSELVTSVRIPIIASGGVATLDDIKALSKTGAYGVIVGKALYTGRFSLRDAMRVSADDRLKIQ
ncbi:MAG: 1-(5-phosphoribosyl)-5-[(5-phosphoribosylamino)methylideneamino]imidazole-4-carboxamide isomerase [Candidatus Micrarchaeia archaeon]